jgi:hypothetical protein
LYLLKTIASAQRSARDPRSIVRNAVLASFFLVLVTLSDWYYLMYCLIFTAVVVAWFGWRAVRTRSTGPYGRAIVAMAGLGILWAALMGPWLIPMTREARQFDFMVPDPAQSRILSADLLAFVTPQEFHPLWGQWAQERAQGFTSTVSEHQVFAGFTALALAVFGVWPARRPLPRAAGNKTGSTSGTRPDQPALGRDAATQSETGLWTLSLVIFFVLALGPVLHVAGRTGLLPGGGELPLPYGWLAQVVPFMNITRSVSRFSTMVMLALGVLAAAGLNRLLTHGKPAWRLGVAGTALGLILFEFLPVPYPMSPPDTPAWYETLAADARPGAVLNLPMNWDRPGYLLYQTVHGKPLTAAYISREDPRTLVERVPVLQHFRRLGPDVIEFDLASQGRQVLADLDVRWVVLDRYKMPGGRERAYTEAAVAEIFGSQAPVYRDERLTVYEVGVMEAARPYLQLGPDWGPFDRETGTRAFVGQASVQVRAPAAARATLRVTLADGSLALPATGKDPVIALTLQPGLNEFALHASQPGGRVVVSRIALAIE